MNTNQVKDKAAIVVHELGLTVESVFVPFSQSRNAGEKNPSLNWLVTLKRDGKKILSCDYMAGMGHCPFYKSHKVSYRMTMWEHERIMIECEKGFAIAGENLPTLSKIPILPDSLDVIHSLLIDAEAFEYDFEEWCGNFGYDTDSRKAESMFNQCRDIGTKLVRAIGTDGLARLQDAFQDY